MRCPTAPRNACAMELEGIISKRRDPDPEAPRRCTGAPSRAASGDPYRRCVPHPCGSSPPGQGARHNLSRGVICAMPSTVSLKPVASAPSLWAMLTGLGGRHRLKLALTYTLTLVENALDVLYPFLTGVAIDALLAGAWSGVAPLLIAWTVHLFVGLFRHVYDTRVFTLVYANLASDLVERQRAQGADADILRRAWRSRAKWSISSRSRCRPPRPRSCALLAPSPCCVFLTCGWASSRCWLSCLCRCSR